MGVLENLAKNPAVLGIAAVGIIAFIFRDKISDFLSNITGGAETANLLGENLLSNLQGTQDLLNSITEGFTNFQFPEFPNPFEGFNFGDFFAGFFNQNGGGIQPPQGGIVDTPGLGPVTIPEGCTVDPQGIIHCPTPPTFDVCNVFPELCQGEQLPPGFTGPPGPGQEQCFEIPLITGGTFNTCTGEQTPGDPVIPGPELPPGFTGGGPSFEGGSVSEVSDQNCTTLICVLDRNPGMTASQAADRLAEILGNTGDFDFGSNTGSGFGPEDDQGGGIITGGATPESEARRAACVSCQLFGLNCPICAGTI